MLTLMNQDTPQYIPDEASLYFPTIAEIKTAQGMRRIFNNVEFDQKEKEKIESFKTHCPKNKHTLTPLWVDAMILRFLQANGFKNDKTLHSVIAYDDFRKQKLPMKRNPKIESFIDAGILYIHGRDNRFRPIVVFNAYKIDTKKLDLDTMMDSLTYILEFILSELFLPGQVENWVFIMDLNRMGLGSLSLGPMKKLMEFLQHNYRGSLFAMYVINTPGSIFLPWRIVKGFLEEATVKKINFFDKGVPEPLFTHAHREQVEKRFGGSAPDVNTYWPAKFPSTNYFTSTDDPTKLLWTKENYLAKYKSGALQSYKVNQKLVAEPKKEVAIPKKDALGPNSINLEISSTKVVEDKKTGSRNAPKEGNYIGEGDYVSLMEENVSTKRLPVTNTFNEHYCYFHGGANKSNVTYVTAVSSSLQGLAKSPQSAHALQGKAAEINFSNSEKNEVRAR